MKEIGAKRIMQSVVGVVGMNTGSHLMSIDIKW